MECRWSGGRAGWAHRCVSGWREPISFRRWWGGRPPRATACTSSAPRRPSLHRRRPCSVSGIRGPRSSPTPGRCSPTRPTWIRRRSFRSRPPDPTSVHRPRQPEAGAVDRTVRGRRRCPGRHRRRRHARLRVGRQAPGAGLGAAVRTRMGSPRGHRTAPAHPAIREGSDRLRSSVGPAGLGDTARAPALAPARVRAARCRSHRWDRHGSPRRSIAGARRRRMA